MYIEDLTRFPPNHPPSPYNFPAPVQKGERWGYGLLPGSSVLCAVGWLGDFVPSKGNTPEECVSRLWDAYKSKYVIFDGTAGFHNCELCQGKDDWYPGGQVGPIISWRGQELRVEGYGHFLVQSDKLIYLSPVLILHYILDHGYRPPDVFVEAVSRDKFLAPSDLIWVEDMPN
jgi:hypothetical protein